MGLVIFVINLKDWALVGLGNFGVSGRINWGARRRRACSDFPGIKWGFTLVIEKPINYTEIIPGILFFL